VGGDRSAFDAMAADNTVLGAPQIADDVAWAVSFLCDAVEVATVVDLLGMGFAMRKLVQRYEVPGEMFGVAVSRLLLALLETRGGRTGRR
jgi:hypothetical protein